MIVTDVFALTGVVLMVKLALLAPAAMLTLAGTCATDVLLLWSMTITPLRGAGPFNVTVPVELAPPTTELGLLLIEDNVAALTVRAAVLLVPRVAVIVVELLFATAYVVAVKVAVVLPAGTDTDAGTVAAAVLLLCNATDVPPVGAGPVRVTVPVEFVPPVTELGLSERAERVLVTALTVSVAPA